MAFLLQLDAQDLPSVCDLFEPDEVLQFFCCTSDEGCETWEPFSATHEIRQLRQSRVAIERPEDLQEFPARWIVGWDLLEDWPSPEEASDPDPMAMPPSYKSPMRRLLSFFSSSTDNEAYDEGVPAERYYPADGDKLGGWPAWVQAPHYPTCRVCETEMEPVFQIESRGNLPIKWGDLGRGHITRCPQHRDILTFAWACT